MKKFQNILLISLGILLFPSLVRAENIFFAEDTDDNFAQIVAAETPVNPDGNFSDILEIQTSVNAEDNFAQIVTVKTPVNSDGNFSDIIEVQNTINSNDDLTKLESLTINCQNKVSCYSLEISNYPLIISEKEKQESLPIETSPDNNNFSNAVTENQNQSFDKCSPSAGEDSEIFTDNSEKIEVTDNNESARETTEKPITHVPQLTPEEIATYKKIAEADRHYRCGQIFLAEKLYREIKAPFPAEINLNRSSIPEAIYEPEQLKPGGAVYWRLYQEGLADQRFQSKILAPLKLLTEQYPEFIPGHLHYAQALRETNRPDQAKKVLNYAVDLYPNQPPLVKAKIEQDQAEKNWLEASLTARRFALLNPDHFLAPEFTQLAEENLQRYQSDLNEKLTLSAVGNVILGGLGYAFLGNLNGPLSALETTILLMEGEEKIGDRFANQLKTRLPLIEDATVVNYVQEIGQKIAAVAGRNEFNYQFYIVMDEDINAFALPGGKIFINAGAILNTHSEAELAGLLAHEISHAALSHGFQLMTQGNLTVNLAQFIPFVGYTAANLIVLNYSREMEQQADVFGTRILTASAYAADGVRGLMVILDNQSNADPPAWLSTHPNTSERVQYLEELIVREGLNRYAYEGVVRHWQIRKRLGQILDEYNQNRQQ